MKRPTLGLRAAAFLIFGLSLPAPCWPAPPARAPLAGASGKPAPTQDAPAETVVLRAGVFTIVHPTGPPPASDVAAEAPPASLPVRAVLYALYAIALVIGVYTLRHYFFTLNRLFGRQKHPYTDVDTADWPRLTVFIAAHNEEQVIAHILEALLRVDYPRDRLEIMPVNDRSQDHTREIIDSYVERYPGRITPFHRTGGKPGKAAALKDACQRANGDIFLIFDADYIPGKGLLKQLVAPFFDPEVGAVMGRVVPLNVGHNLLTRLLDLERSGGYQVDQQARMNLSLVPQYGGTVGGVRKAALDDIGGWREDTLAEDTDLTFRLLIRGWKTVYQNRAECYEEVPENWPVRVKQIMRWAIGHNQAMVRYTVPLFTTRRLGLLERVDGFLLLGIYALSPMLLVGWALAGLMFYLAAFPVHGILVILALASYGTLGNFAAYFEIAAAARLDGSRNRIRLLPFNSLGFLISLVSISNAAASQIYRRRTAGKVWDKTPRFRKETGV